MCNYVTLNYCSQTWSESPTLLSNLLLSGFAVGRSVKAEDDNRGSGR